jgi:hypothetical protein
MMKAGGYASVNLGKPSLFRLPRFATFCNARGLKHNPEMKPRPLIHGEDSTSYVAVEHVMFTRMDRDSTPLFDASRLDRRLFIRVRDFPSCSPATLQLQTK